MLEQTNDSYRSLPGRFYSLLDPTPVASPRIIRFNQGLAAELGLASLANAPDAALFSGNELPVGSQPLAMAYAGHQFGQFVPQLGDGRAILLGEATDRQGRSRDIQLKGSGPTPYSRGGDGRAALGPVLREYLVSEAMHALGIPTTRALAAVSTGEPVYREGALPGAILTRVASSHVRVGTFQYFAARGEQPAVAQLADWVIQRHYPDCAEADQPLLALLEAIQERQASLVAGWMLVGFIHGVMNTDNMAVSGETIDYGPCAFMDRYDPRTVFSSIDRNGRYAYINQPPIAQWNLARLAETLLPLLPMDQEQAVAEATAVIEGFPNRFQHHWMAGMERKLGLLETRPDDGRLAHDLLDVMHADGADYTLTFRQLSELAQNMVEDSGAAWPGPPPSQALEDWLQRWRDRVVAGDLAQRAQLMKSSNPAVIPRNHQVERALEAAIREQDFGPFERLVAVLAAPFDDADQWMEFTQPPEPTEQVYQTFCGT